LVILGHQQAIALPDQAFGQQLTDRYQPLSSFTSDNDMKGMIRHVADSVPVPNALKKAGPVMIRPDRRVLFQ
jgi:hypothetical protein